ncbi:uncharacterized protein [Amphiura filiformis]|uniref:uncharacterized protein n=1 Tax=Amphiura filiformis TaxID=82378 RepID=UPI003B2156B5
MGRSESFQQPNPEESQVVKECLESDNTLSERTILKIEQIVELIEICLNTTCFSYKGKYFKQQHGCAMGAPVSPIVVNLCMESFEQQALKSYPGTKPRVWLRFVDDTFVILNRSELDGFFEHINSVNDNIKFTQELCKDDTLAFLDCLISVQSDGTLTYKVYRKPTHTDHYLQFGSHHPLVHKLGVIRTLQYRADTIIGDSEQVPEEKDHIKTALNNCGYPDWAFLKATKSKEPKTGDASGQANRARVTIPYISGISGRVKNHFKSFGITTSFKPVNTLRGKLVNVKDKQPKDKRSNLVYGVVCGDTDCSAAYVGETKQALKTRIGQHRRPSTNKAQNSAVYLHLKDTGHSIKNEEVVILDKEEQWHRRGQEVTITLVGRGGLYVNSAINSFIYAFSGKFYRDGFREAFGILSKKDKLEQTKMTNISQGTPSARTSKINP